MATFTFHTDAGHGWLEVTTRQLKEVGLTPGDFSAYSYQRRDVLYLEEDVDASVFLRTWEAHKGPSGLLRGTATTTIGSVGWIAWCRARSTTTSCSEPNRGGLRLSPPTEGDQDDSL